MRAEYSPAFHGASTRRRPVKDAGRAPPAPFPAGGGGLEPEHDFASHPCGCPHPRAGPIFNANVAQRSSVRRRPPRGLGRGARPPGDLMTRPAMLIVDHDEMSRSRLKERIAAVSPPGM